MLRGSRWGATDHVSSQSDLLDVVLLQFCVEIGSGEATKQYKVSLCTHDQIAVERRVFSGIRRQGGELRRMDFRPDRANEEETYEEGAPLMMTFSEPTGRKSPMKSKLSLSGLKMGAPAPAECWTQITGLPALR